MSLRASVIICSHNPRTHCLARTLEALHAQTLSLQEWELILVDNASAKPLAQQWDLSWHPGARHLLEPLLGLTHARLAGIRAARARLLVFFDDDNVPDPEYLGRAVDFARVKPALGVFGAGIIEPEFEVAPDPKLKPYLPFIAVRSIAQTVEKLDPTVSPIPCGAGLCVRDYVAQRYAAVIAGCPIRSALGRAGKRLLSGEDDEFSWVAQGMGLRHAVIRELRLLHLIEARRTQLPYLESVIRGSGYSSAMLAKAHSRPEHNPYALPSTARALALVREMRLLRALFEAYRLIKFRCRSPLARRIATALAEGWDEGLADYYAKIAPLMTGERRIP